MAPTPFDLWFNLHLSGLLGKSPAFDNLVVEGIAHNLLGGYLYGAVLFVCWIRGSRAGGDKVQGQLLCILLATMIAIPLMLGTSHFISRVPPGSDSRLASRYPRAVYKNEAANSFPSYSTALYTSIALGTYALDQGAAWLLGLGVVFLVALPRIYVGGHYPTDVLAGMVLGTASYFMARAFRESRLNALWNRMSNEKAWSWILGQVIVYSWLLNVCDEFRQAKWFANWIVPIIKTCI